MQPRQGVNLLAGAPIRMNLRVKLVIYKNLESYSQHFNTSRIFYSWQTFPAQCNVTLKLIWPIHKLRRQWSVVNMVPGVKSTTFHFLRSLQIGTTSQMFCSWQASPAQCNVTLKVIWPIHKLQSKLCVVNMVPGDYIIRNWE